MRRRAAHVLTSDTETVLRGGCGAILSIELSSRNKPQLPFEKSIGSGKAVARPSTADWHNKALEAYSGYCRAAFGFMALEPRHLQQSDGDRNLSRKSKWSA